MFVISIVYSLLHSHFSLVLSSKRTCTVFISNRDWHGHVTAISVAEEYRRLGLAAVLMKLLEDVSEQKKCYFVDLFVRVSNSVAVSMYKNLGYVVYRTITNYYSGPPDEDAYDMRKALSRDKEKLSEKPCSDPDFPIEAA